ncbi:SEC10/PgrA surface exclusion domain-containing protein [Lactobacillus intestinalis]|uniref:SEC10/PgrA surface exclusion domain-containing protein n=1 Tax=Lactobacillus intestinalis TaxID=151781 RepID=UPI001F56DB1C|nr:SEC10/PgrA surface exclusion domain-containing protein [Lactobacillus intestinalis]
MNKKVKVTSLAAAALTSVVLAGANLNHEVKAATVPEGTSAKAQSAQDNAQANVESAQKEVDSAQADVNTAKSNLDSAQGSAQTADSAYNDQNNKAQAAQKNENEKKATLDKAQDAKKTAQQLVADSKDSAKVKQANDDVTNKQNAVKTAQGAQTAADQKVSDQNKVVAKDQTAVHAATTVRDQKQTDKDTADAQVKTAQDALNGTGIAEAKDAKDKAEATMNQTASDLKQAQAQRDELANKNADYAKLAKEVGNDQNLAQQKVDQAKKDTDTAIKKSNDLNQQLQKLMSLNEDLKQNNLKFSDVNKYKTAFLDYYNGTLTDEDKAYIAAERSNPNNQYHSSEADKKEVISDINNLSDDQIKDLTLFSAHLINGLRNQLGWEDMTVTKGSLDFAKEVAQKYVSDLKAGRWDDKLDISQDDDGDYTIGADHWHNVAGINNAAKDHGLEYEEGNLVYNPQVQMRDQDYEDMGDAFFNNPVTMDQLKEKMFETISAFVFPDGNGKIAAEAAPEFEFGHAAGILGIAQNAADGFQKAGVNEAYITNLKEVVDDAEYNIKTYKQNISIDEDRIREATQQLQKYPNDADELNSEIKDAQADMADTQKDLEKEQKNLDLYAPQYGLLSKTHDTPYIGALPTYYETINTPVPGYENMLFGGTHFLTIYPDQITDSSKFDFTEVPSYEEQIEENKKAQIVAQKNLQKAQGMEQFATLVSDSIKLKNKLKSNTNDFNTATKKYNELTADNKTKTANLEKARTAQKQAQSELTDAQTKLKDAQQTLDDAKKNLETLQKDAQSKGAAVKQAQTALETAQKHVEDLKNAPQILKNANDAKAKAQTEYDAAKKALNEAEAQIKKLENEKSTADGQVATAQATYDQALARLKNAQDKLAMAKESLNKIQNDQKAISNSHNKSGENKVKKNNKTVKGTSKDSKRTTKTTKKSKKVLKHVRLTHNAFVYTKSGKAIRSGLHFKLIKRGKSLKTFNNAKIVTINGKRFYQIGKNQFVKIANAKIIPNVVRVRAIVKAKRVSAYDRFGKLRKHSIKGRRAYTFNEKLTINGKTYYKIAWTNNWIPASKLNLR